MKMTTTQAMDLLSVRNGADVYDYGIALNLRAIEKERPQWINIGPAESAPDDGAKRQPYFGAIATMAGISAARRAIKRNDEFEAARSKYSQRRSGNGSRWRSRTR